LEEGYEVTMFNRRYDQVNVRKIVLVILGNDIKMSSSSPAINAAAQNSS